MKKIIVFCVLVCVLAVSGFAQLNTGGYTKSYWTPYRVTVYEDEDAKHTTAVQAPWGEPDISAGMNFDAWSEWGGFHMGIGIANGAANRPATGYSATGSGWVWVKPFGFVPALQMNTFTIWLGNPVDEKLMGKIGGSNLATYVLNKSYTIHGEKEREFRMEIQDPAYNIFTRINPYPWGNANEVYQNIWWPRIAAAAMITWEPIENLYITAFTAPEMFRLIDWNKDSAGMNNPRIDSVNGENLRGDDINQDFYDVKEVYSKMQIAVGYDIPGLGLARVQWVGVRNVIEGAFQLRALGDLVLDVGLKIPYEGTVKDVDNAYLTSTYKKRRDFQASAAATYRNYNFRVMGRVDTAFAGSDSVTGGDTVLQRGLNLIAYVVPSYVLDAGTVGVDLGFEYEQKDDFNGWKDDSVQAGAGIWFARSMGNANFKAALVSRFPLEWEGAKQPFDFMIPIILEVGF
jgi:hypothetical protein